MKVERRSYGQAGDRISILGFGGIIVKTMPQEEADRYVQEAIEAGVNYFDVAPNYEDAELQLGPALRPFRKQVFLACKTAKRDKKESRLELERSLQRHYTDYFDLYQLHGLVSQAEFEQVTGPKGALETLIQAKEEGLIRHIGFSAHSVQVALQLMDTFPFDSVLFPINFVNWYQGEFGLQVVEAAKKKGLSVLALKALAKQTVATNDAPQYDRCWYEPIDDPEMAALAIRWTLSQDVVAAVPPGDIRLFRLALAACRNFSPVSADEIQRLRDYAQGLRPIFSIG